MDKANLILNSTIELVDVQEEGNGKGRPFVSRFLEPGIAHYKELGDILITKETLNKFIHTMVGCPVIIEHEDVTDENVDKLRVGVVSRVWFNEMDGYFYCEGILTDPEAIDLVKNQGYNVSCAYSFVSDNTKKTHNGKEIDMEFIDGEFLHLALVKDPRYEGANIVVNKNDDDLEWITVKGNHIPVKKGQSKDEAVKEFLEGKGEGKQNNKEADIALTMMAQDYEKRGNKGTVDRANELKEKLKKGEELSDKDKQDIKTAIESYKPKDKSGDSGDWRQKESEAIKEKFEGTSWGKQLDDMHEYIKERVQKQFDSLDEDGQAIAKAWRVPKSIERIDAIKDAKVYVAKDNWGSTKLMQVDGDGEAKGLGPQTLANMFSDKGKVVDLGYDHENWTPLEEGLQDAIPKRLQKYQKVTSAGDKELYLTTNVWGDKTFVSVEGNKYKRLSHSGLAAFLKGDKNKSSKANNSIGDITMTVLNDLTDFIKKVVKNEKDEEMKEVKNEDKRKLIDEVGGILKGKVDEELWRTVIGKLEKVAYEPSEDSKADNEDDEEKEAKNKCKNEEDEKEEEIEEKVTENEDEEEKEEKAENKKVKNSMKDIVMGGSSQAQTQKLYTSRKERLEEGNKY